MAEPFIGELRLMSFNFAPKNWALCNGQTMSIAQNQALFSVLGTMYGGNGQTTFALPDLRGRVPVHAGNGWLQGEVAGEESHRLSVNELPTHQHALLASSSDADSAVPTGSVLAAANNGYAPATQQLTALRSDSISLVGGNAVHENRHPYLTLSWCMALFGIYPARV